MVFASDFDELSRRAMATIDTNPQEAVTDFRQALAERPGWAEGWLYMGSSLFKLGRFQEACDALRKGIALQPQKGTPVAFLGMAEYELGDYQHALPEILKGESIGLADDMPFVAAVHYRAAVMFLLSSDFPQAMEQLQPLVHTGNKSNSVVDALGLCVLHINAIPGKTPESQRDLIRRAGEAAWAYEGDRLDEATKLFQQLAVQFPASPWVHYSNGVNLIHDDPAAAEKELERELRIAPHNALAHGQLALLLAKRGDADAAVKQAREAVRLRPSDAWCRTTLGRVLLSSGQLSGAITELEGSNKLAPNAAATHFYLAEAYRRAGKEDKARAEHD